MISRIGALCLAMAVVMGCAEQPDDAGASVEGSSAPSGIGNGAAEGDDPQPVRSTATPEAQIDEGIELSDVGRHEEAIARFEIVASSAPDPSHALIAKAVALSKLHRFDEAIATLESPVLRGNGAARERLDQLLARRLSATAIVVLPIPDGLPYDLMWMLAVEDFGSALNVIVHDGRKFVKVGTSRALHQDAGNLMDPASDALGLVYTLVRASPIVRATVLPPAQLGGFGLTSAVETEVLLLQVGDQLHVTYTLVAQSPETGRFRWRRLRDGVEQEFDANDVVPPGFAPITSLRLAEVPGMDRTDAVPQLNARGIEAVQHRSRNRVRLWGVPLLNRWKQGVLLAERREALNAVRDRQHAVFHGDGRWRWDNGPARDPNAIEVVVVGHGDMGPVFVDPFDAPIWTFRRERIHEHRMF